MKKTNIYITKIQTDSLKKLSDKSGLSVSELMRRALDDFLERLEESSSVKEAKGKEGKRNFPESFWEE